VNKIKRGDTVLVIAGKDKGKRGVVRHVYPEKNRAIVEGVNMVKRHQRQRSQTQPGGIIEREAAIHLSNLMLIDPSSSKPTRVGFTRRPDGVKVRVARVSGEIVD
jgi:large subunit ribosomal protein L24